ncbi:hypothetical protein DINM_006164 [Dirofilaria immitis]|nr:hypothetical protein [Dirofilaria immitis]
MNRKASEQLYYQYYNEKVVVTQIFQNDETAEAFDFDQAKVKALVHEEMIKPLTYMAKVKTITPIVDTKDPKMLRKFDEKKKLYANDPQSLRKVYEEEWKRIENLTARRRQPHGSSQPSDGGQSNDNQPCGSDQSRGNTSTMQMSSKRLRQHGASTVRGSLNKKDSRENKQS